MVAILSPKIRRTTSISIKDDPASPPLFLFYLKKQLFSKNMPLFTEQNDDKCAVNKFSCFLQFF